MVLIYSHIGSSRLQYTCSFVFKELLGIDYELTIDSDAFKNFTGVKINYSDTKITAAEFYIKNHTLLFDHGIQNQTIDCFIFENTKAFFKTENSDLPFDIFAASFYLLSRYEEYLPHKKDMYGRYAHENSLAYHERFLNLPLVNIWVKSFAEKLKQKFAQDALGKTFNFQLSTFNFLPTYDIDIAYSYRHKGLLRNAGGFLKSPSAGRIKVLAGIVKDPFDSYAWLHALHQQYNVQPVYFFLVAEQNGLYDKNILPHTDAMWRLVKLHAKKYRVGLHPSWQSGDNGALLKTEKELLEAMSGNSVTRSRQHYIRFNLPEGYQRLIAAGITDDYSMGYGSINGFRASVASSFNWYDLQNERLTALRIHPFCFMDANAFYEQKQTPRQSATELLHYYTICKSVNGTLITIFHNNFLGTAKEFAGWQAIYEQFTAQVQQ
jgi:hypothetical protein